MRRGEVWLVTLDPTVGSEIQKTRPCLIVSPPDLVHRLRTLIVIPLTTGSRPARFRVPLKFQDRQGLVLPEQVRSVDQSRFIRFLGVVDDPTLAAVLAVLREMFEEQ